jgi:hypothetical protein
VNVVYYVSALVLDASHSRAFLHPPVAVVDQYSLRKYPEPETVNLKESLLFLLDVFLSNVKYQLERVTSSKNKNKD